MKAVQRKAAKRNTQNAKAAEVVQQLETAPLLGQIITWHAGKKEHVHADLVNALSVAGLDTGIARTLLPRHAWSRACRKLTDDRMIDAIREDDTHIFFQFTKKFVAQNGGEHELQFVRETKLRLDKSTGEIVCPNQDVQIIAKTEFDKAMELRTPSDVTRIIQNLFDSNADLFPIREQGGAYFVPIEHSAFVEKVWGFLSSLGGRMRRFPVPTTAVIGGSENPVEEVRDVMVDGMEEMIAAHAKAVEEFTVDTRESTMERAIQNVNVTRVKLQAYAHYLAEQHGRLAAELDAAEAKLALRIGTIKQVAADESSDLFAACDHCGAPNAVKEGDTSCICCECGKDFPLE